MRPLFAFFAGLLLLSCGNKSNTSIEKNGPKEEEILSLYKLYTSGNYNAYVDAMQSCDDKPETYRQEMKDALKQHARYIDEEHKGAKKSVARTSRPTLTPTTPASTKEIGNNPQTFQEKQVTPKKKAVVEEKQPEKDIFGDWDIRREATVRETTTETDSPFAQKSFVEAPVETKYESDDTLDTPPFFRRRNRN